MKIKEFRQIDMYTLRNLCIENQYYTCGSSADYNEMLHMVVRGPQNPNPRKLTTGLVLQIAENIAEHSDIGHIMDERCFSSYKEMVKQIAQEIIKASDTIVYEVA